MPFDYDHCRVCGGLVPPSVRELAARRIENAICGSTACARKELIDRFGCCAKAVLTPCVCAYSFRCPDHGERHIGTHD